MSDDFIEEGARLLAALDAYYAAAGEGRVFPERELAELLARWPAQVGDAPAETLEELTARALEDSVQQQHPGYLGYQLSAPLPRAALLELLAGALNNGMASYDSGPAASAAEVAAVRILCDRIGYARGDGVLTSGGSLGNLTALLAARARAAGSDAWARGVGPGMRIAVSADAHYSVARAAGIMGLGTDACVPVALDARRRMLPGALEEALRERPIFAVVANAGSTPVGAFDPLDELADVCAAHDVWLHVDGAHGASVVLSDALRDRARGIERADSVVWDGHKMMQLPALCTAVLFRDPDDAWRAFHQQAPYLYEGESVRRYDLGQRTVECTKRGMGLVLYGALRTLGLRPFVDYVERQVAMAARFADLLEAAEDFELATRPECNIVCYRFAAVPPAERDEAQLAIRSALIRGGGFFVGRTRLDGEVWLRSTVMNPSTEAAHLEGLLEAIRDAARGAA